MGHYLIVVAFALLAAHGHQDDGFSKGLFLVANVAVGHMSPLDGLQPIVFVQARSGKGALPEVPSTAGSAQKAMIPGRNLPTSLPEPLNMSNEFGGERQK
ncbi:hypothetical protein [Pseudomonas sp. Pseusp97]|uniref:hypothetical protein n=1 Tax=Pseudomonas sp. Pseusp97 TaxID=3243065 RepID=UPI0039A42602